MAQNLLNGCHLNEDVVSLVREQKELDSVYRLLNCQDVNIICNLTDDNGSTLLHIAAKFGNVKMIKQLIKLGVNVNLKNLQGETPLMLAVCVDSKVPEKAIKILLDAGADVFIKSEDKRNALQVGLDKGRKSKNVTRMFLSELVKMYNFNDKLIAKLLIEVKCSLAQVIYMNRPDVTKNMIELGSPVNTNNLPDGSTALHVAVEMANLGNVKILLENDADVNAKDTNGDIPLNRLTSHRCPATSLQILNLLIDHGSLIIGKNGAPYIPPGCAFEQGTEKLIGFLLRRNINISQQRERTKTVLHYLTFNHSVPSLADELHRLLRGKKFNVDAIDEKGNTPLICAVANANVNMVEFLVESGANVNFKSDNSMPLFETIIDIWDSYLMTKKIRCMEILLDNGANPQEVLAGGETIFDRIILYRNAIMSQPILLHLAIADSLGQPISDLIRRKIKSKSSFTWCFEGCKKFLNGMKKIVIYESITLFDVLIVMREKKAVSILMNNSEFFSKLKCKGRKKLETEGYEDYRELVYQMLRNRLEKLIANTQLRLSTMNFICENAGLRTNSCHVIADMIIDFLDNRDMSNLNEAIHCTWVDC